MGTTDSTFWKGGRAIEAARFLSSASFWTPERLAYPPSWAEHIPFAFWLVEALRPTTLVELGVHTGNSYCAFCQAVETLRLNTRCFGVDTWVGDPQAGFYGNAVFEELSEYHDQRYGQFSRLVRATFDEARQSFGDSSIDLLHIDGLHTYETVRHDFENWRPKLSSRAVVLFHDIEVRERDFGVFRLWSELTEKFPHFAFVHGHGLGVLGVGSDLPSTVRELFAQNSESTQQIQQMYRSVGRACSQHIVSQSQLKALQKKLDDTESNATYLRKEVSGLQKELAGYGAELANAQEHPAPKDRALNGEPEQSGTETATLTGQLRELQDYLEIRHKNHRAALGSLMDELNIKQSEVNVLKARVKESQDCLKQTWSNHDSEIVALREQLKTKQAAVDSLQSQQAKLALKLRDQGKQIADLRRKCKNLTSESRKARQGIFRRVEQSIRKKRKDLLGRFRSSDADQPAENPQKVDESTSERAPGSEIPLLFDVAYYLQQVPNGEADESPLEHYRSVGWRRGYNPHPLFDAKWYMRRYPDVAASRMDPLEHYLTMGWREARSPHPMMDSAWYLKQYPDILEAGLDPLQHYLDVGWRENRQPHPRATAAWITEFVKSGAFGDPLERAPDSVLEFDRDCARLDPTKETVLIVTHETSRSGAPTIAYNLVSYFRENYNVATLMLRGGPLREAFRVQSTVTNQPPTNAALDVNSINLLIAVLLRHTPVTFAITNSIESGLTLPSLARNDLPIVNLIHEFAAYTRPVTRIQEACFYAGLNVFPACLVQENALQNCPDILPETTCVLPQGLCTIPESEKKAADQRMEREVIRTALRPPGWEDAVVVVGMGAVQIRKGVDLFFSCAAKVLERNPDRKIRFVWIGEGYDPDRDLHFSVYLADQLSKLSGDGSATLLSEVSQPDYVYELADICFVSSRLDPFPLVAQEAMAHGLPVVAFRNAVGTVEILQKDPICDKCIADYLDVEDAARALQPLLDDEAHRRDVGAHCRILADEHFDNHSYCLEVERVARRTTETKRREIADRSTIVKAGALDLDFLVSPFAPEVHLDPAWWYTRSWASNIRMRKPFPGFHPGIYREHTEVSNRDPLAHYLESGRPEGPWHTRVILPGDESPAPSAPCKAALHIHVFYEELVEEICERLRRNASPVDLFVTVPNGCPTEVLRSQFVRCGMGSVEIVVVQNRGRDIGAMLTGLKGTSFWDYEYIGHMHTKKSSWLNEPGFVKLWRTLLLENQLGGKHAMMDRVFEAFRENEKLGMVFPEDPHVLGWGANRSFAEPIASRLGLYPDLPEALNFPIGSFFWARSDSLRKVADLDLEWDDYPPEPVPGDGSMLHAIERLLPLVVESAGYEVAVTYVPGVTR